MIRMMTEKKAEALEAQIELLYRRRLTNERLRRKSGVVPVATRKGVRSSLGDRAGGDANLLWLARLAGDVAALRRRSA